MKQILLSVFLGVLFQSVIAQDDPVLFTYGNDSVRVSEFMYTFNKSNPKDVVPTEQDIRDYLELYINFKLKVKEARDLRIDTLPGVINELNIYRAQLLQSYIDKEILDKLTKETYDRLTKDVDVSHIMVSLKPDAPPEDTLRAYNKIMSLRNRIMSGEKFEDVARDASEDPSAKENGGHIGYITALQIPFLTFEDAAYSTPVGAVSMPVRTKLGYHLVKVNEVKPAWGEIEVAHILIKTPKNVTEAQIEKAREKADSLYKALLDSASFEDLARKYSDDKSTAGIGGKLPRFGVGRMVPIFERTAFSLQHDGDIAAPVQTQYGFHIIKRLHAYPVKPYEEMKEDLEKRIKRDNRYKRAEKQLLAAYRKEYSYMEFPGRVAACAAYLDSSIYKGKWHRPSKLDDDPVVLMIAGQAWHASDLLQYIRENQSKIRSGSFENMVKKHFEQFSTQKLEEYAFTQRYPEFRYLEQEYVDGTLLFKLTEEKVWSKAMKDTSGLEEFYNQHKENHMWGPRVDAWVCQVNSKKAGRLVKLWSKRKSPEDIMLKLNADPDHPQVNITSRYYEKGDESLIDPWFDQTGWTDLIENPEGSEWKYHRVWIRQKLEPVPKSLDEAKGFFISDYQDFLEKMWIADLREKYPVLVNEGVLQTLFH